jgi:hypothetical protein
MCIFNGIFSFFQVHIDGFKVTVFITFTVIIRFLTVVSVPLAVFCSQYINFDKMCVSMY